jgi:tetratricopeptide (TPR) repeat protein
VTGGARLVLLCSIALAAGTARADLLHLQGGGVLSAERWWIEGDTLHVESAGGVVGLPRTLLVRVEPSSPAPVDNPDRRRKGAPVPPLPAPPSVPGELRVSAAIAAKMNEANAAMAARDFNRAALRYYEVLDAVPAASAPRVGYALAEIALGRDAMALPVVLDGITRDPASADLHEILGVLRDREDRVEEALSEWREAFRLAPSDRVRDKIEKAERELAAGRDYATSAAPHFTVRYDGALDQELVAALTDFLEDRYDALASQYRHAPSQPITVLLYPQQAFRDVTLAGREVAGLYDGKIRVPLGGLKHLDAAARRVLAHELTHAFVQSKTRGNCPRWLHEGLAQVAEERKSSRDDAARLAASVKAGAPSTWPEASFSYPSALSLTRYLIARRGFDLVVSLTERLGDGDTLDAALTALYGTTYEALGAEWAESLSAGGVE